MKIYFTKLAYLQLLNEVKKYNHIETGAILIGRVIEEDFYVFESLDSGMNCRRGPAIFYRDNPYSEHLADVVRAKYENATGIGFWHRHPGNFNQFSSADLIANIDMARVLNKNIISGLINIYDGQIKLKFWRITLDNKYDEAQIIIGDEFFKNILIYKNIENIESLILKNELGVDIKKTTISYFTNDIIMENADEKKIEKIKRNKKTLRGFSKKKRIKVHPSNKETDLPATEYQDIESQILNEIKFDLEMLSNENTVCQKYKVDDNVLYNNKVFLTFINLQTNVECDVVLYYIKKQLVFYVHGKEWKYEKSNLLEHVKRILEGEKQSGTI